MRSRRALLYMPGDDLHKITKATRLGVDCICMDMEDGVAFSRKDQARQTILNALTTMSFGASEVLVRINPAGSGWEHDDLAAALAGPTRPDGIVLPKVSRPAQVHWLCRQLDQYEQRHGWLAGSIGVLAVVESALAIANLNAIASADARLQALIFGAEDLASDIGATRTSQGWEVFYARSAVVTYAAAYQLQAIDMVRIDFHDQAALEGEATEGARLGYSGKQIIHPNQVEPVQRLFTPSAEAIDHAQRLVEAFHVYQQSGQGAFALDGRMIDAPIIKAAENVLARARAAGKP
jgi:citrate lyase beta subunit